MHIDKINDKTIKIVLNNQDMQKLNITYENMDYSKSHTKKAITQIIKTIRHEIKINTSQSKICVEAFPKENGGCFMFFNIVDINAPQEKASYSFDTPLVFEFESIDTLSSCCIDLLSNYNHTIMKSCLYLFDNKYRLLIYTYCKMDTQLINFLNEYCTYINKGAVISAITMEHGNSIIEENAIENISKYLK